jgi:hypothetical protein
MIVQNTFPEIGIKGLSRLYHELWTGISNMSMLRIDKVR